MMVIRFFIQTMHQSKDWQSQFLHFSNLSTVVSPIDNSQYRTSDWSSKNWHSKLLEYILLITMHFLWYWDNWYIKMHNRHHSPVYRSAFFLQSLSFRCLYLFDWQFYIMIDQYRNIFSLLHFDIYWTTESIYLTRYVSFRLN